MKSQFFPVDGAEELIVCFLGWDTTPAVAQHLQPNGRALLFCWDYRVATPLIIAPQFATIHLVAWSLGVWAAEENAAHLPWTTAVAINGTPCPSDPVYGIPPAIFAGTLAQLSPLTRQKFARRLCASPAEWQTYQQLPRRDFAEVRAELQAISDRLAAPAARTGIPWQRAWIGRDDRIFPPAAQQRYWQEKGRLFAGGHNLFPQLRDWAQLWS